MTQSIPYVIQPIWRSLHGIIISQSSSSSSYKGSTRKDENNHKYIKWSEFKNRRVTFPYDGNRHANKQEPNTYNKKNQYIVLEYEYTILPNHHFILSLDYQPLFLSFEEFPGDANRGFEIPPTKVVFQLFHPLSPITTTTTTSHDNQTINPTTTMKEQQQQQCQESIKRIQELRHQLSSINNPFFESFDTSVDTNVMNTTTRASSLVVVQMELYSNALLILTPLPDMSMPYNVLSFTCTFYAFLFGSMFNLLIKKANTSMKKKLNDSSSTRTINTGHTLKSRILQKARGTKDRILQKIMAFVDSHKRDPYNVKSTNVPTADIGIKPVPNENKR